MSEFYHKPSAKRESSGAQAFSVPTQAFLGFCRQENLDILFAQMRVDNRIVDEYLSHPLKTRLNVFTVSEGFVGVAVGIAIDEGLLTLEDRLCDSFPAYVSETTSPYCLAVTVRDLLTMTVGLADPLFICDDRARYTTKDWIQYYFDAQFVRMPGETFLHCDLNTYMLACMIEEKAGVHLLEYLRDRLFEPIGIGNPDWLTCPRGHCMGANGLYLTVEEMGAFGQLLINRGATAAKRIVSPGFMDRAVSCQIETGTPPDAGTNSANSGYGYHLWMSHVPGCVLLKGRFGQGVVVSLDKGAVFTFQALEGYRFDEMFDKAAEIMRLL